MNRSADGKRPLARAAPAPAATPLMLAEAVTDLRKLLRVKVEDDQDLATTAQQVLSEAGTFCSWSRARRRRRANCGRAAR